MIEGLISILVAIVDALLGLFTAVVEFIAGLFVPAGQTLTFFDLFAVLFVFALEVIIWLFLSIKELTLSTIKWRKPAYVAKPILWRPEPKFKKDKADKKQ